MNKILVSVFLCFLTAPAFASPQDDLVDQYKKIVAELHACSNMDQYMAVSLKYATKDMVNDYVKNEEKFKQMPPAFKDSMFKMMRPAVYKLQDFVVKKVKIDAESATISYGVNGWPNFDGVANFKSENGVWKLANLKEQGSPPTAESKEAGIAMLKQFSQALKSAGQASKDAKLKKNAAEVGQIFDSAADLAQRNNQGNLALSSHIKILLKNGNVVEGRLIEKASDHLSVEFQGVKVTYYYDEIKKVE